MAEEESKKVEAAEVSAEPAPAAEAPKDVAEEKEVDKAPPPTEETPDDSKALVPVEKVADAAPAEKSSGGSLDRDVVLARVETQKKMSLIKAWEENEKTKAENKAVKKLSAITSWENTKKAAWLWNFNSVLSTFYNNKKSLFQNIRLRLPMLLPQRKAPVDPLIEMLFWHGLKPKRKCL